ncbi:DUF5979 domain-containing protein [Microbacterium oxydans]|uniref:DUF5979 domain-containing protein n=1 Tax=Microbacterium oxydans TaxID=82380 RepID=UPI00367046CD
MLNDLPQPRTSWGRRPTRRGTAIIALLAGLVGLAVAPLPASAAPPYTTEATLSSMQFTESTIQSGTKAELTGAWSLPDNPSAPAGFVVDLPNGLQGLEDAFPLLDANGATVGDCVTTQTQLTCDFDSAYLSTHPIGLSGSFSFWATVTTEVTQQTSVDYDFGTVRATVDVTPPASPCSQNCSFPGRPNSKGGEYDNATDTIVWEVAVGAGPGGMTGGQTVVVEDLLGADQVLIPEAANGEKYPALWATNTLETLANGYQVPGPFTRLPSSDYTVSADGTTVTFVASQGYFYNVEYLSKVTDGGAAGTYTNEAEVTVGTEKTSPTTAQVTRHGGSGTGSGTSVGAFSISKRLLGDTANLDDLTYHGTYKVTPPGRPAVSGEFAVQAGSTWTSPMFPAGSAVELSESLGGLPANLDWAEPQFSPQSFVIGAGSTSAVSLSNTATLRTQSFSALKTLAGESAATATVPADSRYVIEYSYPAGPGFSAGSGELTLIAGTPVTSPALPVGADVTIRERSPNTVDGITWGAPRISPERFTVQDQTVAVSVINPVTATTPPPKSPATPSGLASTGIDAATSMVLLAVLLLGTGASLVVGRRFRSRR